MANDVASRREARRRRILENSENRLQKITGRSDSISRVAFGNEDDLLVLQNGAYSEHIKNGPVGKVISHIPESTCDTHPQNYLKYEESELLQKIQSTPATNNEIVQDMETPISKLSVLLFLYSAKLHLIFLALVVRIMYSVDYSFLFGEALLAPLCIVELTDIVWLHFIMKREKQSSSMLRAALLLSGISSRRVAMILNFVEVVVKLGQDMCVYLFTFITFHALIEWIKTFVHMS